MNEKRPLFQFAYVPKWQETLEVLKDLAEPEDWGYQSQTSDYENPVLNDYLHYTFMRLEEEEATGGDRTKIAVSADSRWTCFNTGLVTPCQEAIFACFEAHHDPDSEAKWFFKSFEKEASWKLKDFSVLPQPAHYFDDPSCLVYDHRLDLRTNTSHIINDNRERFPARCAQMGDYELQNLLEGAIKRAEQRARRNYKTAIPQYYRPRGSESGSMQLLLPMCLFDPDRADLALAVSRHDGFYRASTVLPLDWAYNNARLIAKPDRDWLQP